MITKNVKLYLGDGFPVRIPVSQFDTMWQFVFTIIHNSQPWQIPTGATAVLNGKKPDGNVFAFSGTIENNTVTVDADVQMTAVAGQTVCELSVLSDGKTVGTANFILDVEEAPKSADDVVSDTVLDGYGMMVTNAVDDYIERHPEVFGGDKFTQSAKNALLALLEKVAYIDENGQTYIDALENELFPPASLVSITAVFNQGQNVIYDTDSLDDLKQYLTVTANMSDGTTQTVSNYTLSGTLAEGTSAITVSYVGKTATFAVAVTKHQTISNGSVTFDDGSTVTVLDDHVTIVLGSASGQKFVNLSALANNTSSITSTDNINNQTTDYLSITAGKTVTEKISNATSDNTVWNGHDSAVDIAINLRKKSGTTSIFSPSADVVPTTNIYHPVKTEAEASQEITEDQVAGCLFCYIGSAFPRGTTIEFDVFVSVR